MPRFRLLLTLIPASFALSLHAGCSGPTNPGPVVMPPTIQSISPASGPTVGGTPITIRGGNFASGAAVTIGGRPATDVAVQSADVITARTPASTAAGALDVMVTVNGRSGTLVGGFRYEAPNAAPTIQSLSAQGTRPGQPANFADLGESIRITAVVEDADTAPTALAFQWSATCGGTFIGAGVQVDWRAPTAVPVPQTCTIDVAVVDGANRVTRSVPVRVHDSPREMANLATLFLTEFADSLIPPATTVRNFHDSCKGKVEELIDVTDNRRDYIIDDYEYGESSATIAFGGVCGFRVPLFRGDACVKTPVKWQSTIRSTKKSETATGTSHINGVYRESRWWLCDSAFQGTTTSGLKFLD